MSQLYIDSLKCIDGYEALYLSLIGKVAHLAIIQQRLHAALHQCNTCIWTNETR